MCFIKVWFGLGFLDRSQPYVTDNLKGIRNDCDQLKQCLDELYAQENRFIVLDGNGIGLKHICDFVQPARKQLSFQCSNQEREIIRYYLVIHLASTTRDDHDNRWAELKQCISNSTDKTTLDRVCNLTPSHHNEDNLCDNRHLHQSVEHFLNTRLDSLQCTCDALSKDSLNVPLIFGATVGGLVVIVLISIVLCCLVWKRKKNSPQMSMRTQDSRRVSFSASTSDKDGNVSMYSEISDNIMPLNRQRKKDATSCESTPPRLPSRYVKDPTCVYNSPWDGPTNGNNEYLEPLNPTRSSNMEEISIMVDNSSWGGRPNAQASPQRGSDLTDKPPDYLAPDPPSTRAQHGDDDGSYETLGSYAGGKVRATIEVRQV